MNKITNHLKNLLPKSIFPNNTKPSDIMAASMETVAKDKSITYQDLLDTQEKLNNPLVSISTPLGQDNVYNEYLRGADRRFVQDSATKQMILERERQMLFEMQKYSSASAQTTVGIGGIAPSFSVFDDPEMKEDVEPAKYNESTGWDFP